MTSRKKRPRDTAQLARLVVDIATGEVEDREPTPTKRAAPGVSNGNKH